MATKIQRRSMRKRLKLGNSYQKDNVDICHTDENLSIAIDIQIWIHDRTHTNNPSQLGENNEFST